MLAILSNEGRGGCAIDAACLRSCRASGAAALFRPVRLCLCFGLRVWVALTDSCGMRAPHLIILSRFKSVLIAKNISYMSDYMYMYCPPHCAECLSHAREGLGGRVALRCKDKVVVVVCTSTVSFGSGCVAGAGTQSSLSYSSHSNS